MRREIGYWNREQRSRCFYLEFDELSAEFFLTIEDGPVNQPEQVRRVPLHQAQGERYYNDALLLIREELFKHYQP